MKYTLSKLDFFKITNKNKPKCTTTTHQTNTHTKHVWVTGLNNGNFNKSSTIFSHIKDENNTFVTRMSEHHN